ncbi:hypothetical protein [Streptomyces sp. URMC 124]|uniref:hypothetical protein n=1 Tax=Streptomyces sp. URMC 124 TaxID=3423405 RepID=UPI003F1C1216
MSTQSIEQQPLPPWARARDNSNAVQVMVDGSRLPAPAIIGRADAVYIAVADVDDLGEWLAVLGGEIHVSPSYEGIELWTLHTYTPIRGDGSRVSIRVSVPLPAHELVMDDILAAVSR